MCGISGEISFIGTTADRKSVERMGNKISHRGSMGPIHFFSPYISNLSISFNWLPIQDINAVPPIQCREWIVWLNGEIYNHNDLREDLDDPVPTCAGDTFRDNPFKTKSDTETIAVGLHHHGIEFIKKLNGIFVIVAYNTKTKALYIFRDRFGAKQIYYHDTGKKLIFSSEPKAFLAHKDYSFDVNKNSVGQWLSYQNYFSDEILFNGIHLLQPGEYLIYSDGLKKYKFHEWEMYESNIKFREMYLKNMLDDAFKRQIPNEKFGLWLSGGLDSSILALAMNPNHCITAGWTEKELDERRVAEAFSSRIKTIHHQIYLCPKSLVSYFDKTIQSLDDLRVGPSWSNYILNEVISKHCRITIQGTGADELFGGYQWRYDAKDYYDVIDRSKLQTGFIRHPFERAPVPTTLLGRYKFDMNYFLQGLLIVGDRLSMAHTVEERVPFLDNAVADVACSLMISERTDKKILREIFKSSIPGMKKKGFTSPDKLWYQHELNKFLIKRLIGSKSLSEYVDMGMIDRVIKENNAPAIWSLLALDSWLNTYSK